MKWQIKNVPNHQPGVIGPADWEIKSEHGMITMGKEIDSS